MSRTKIGRAAAVTVLLFGHTDSFSCPPIVALAVPSSRNHPLLPAPVIWSRISSTKQLADSVFLCPSSCAPSSRNIQLCIYKSWINDANRTNLKYSFENCVSLIQDISSFRKKPASVSGFTTVNPLNAELNPICHLLALLGGATIVVVSRLRFKFFSRRHAVYVTLHYCQKLNKLPSAMRGNCIYICISIQGSWQGAILQLKWLLQS
jgi:hypothetical protein